MSPSLDIELPRQADFIRGYTLTDIDKVPIDITGATVSWSARAIAGSGMVLATAEVEIIDPAAGKFEARWRGPDFNGYGLHTEIVRVAHDIKLTYPDGVADVLVRGQILLYPEVTV